MHRCLKIAEIVHNVVNNISPYMNQDCDAIVDLASVANFALTCRAFTEPALDRLWYELPSLRPLLQLLPEDSWELIRVKPLSEDTGSDSDSDDGWVGPTYLFRFTRTLQPNDWMHFSAYARRVRSFMHVQESVTEISVAVSVLRDLSLHKPFTRLLPRLRELVWMDDREDALPYIHLFLSPDITRLQVGYPEDPQDVDGQTARQLSTLSASCPSIKSLDSLQIPLPLLSRILTSGSPGFSKLESLVVLGSLPEDALSYLAKLSSLKCFKYSPIDDQFPEFHDVHAFASLCDFEITLWSDSDAAQIFLERTRLPNLTKLSIVIHATLSLDQFRRLYNTISKFASLRELMIKTFASEDPPPVTTSMSINVNDTAIIAPLLALRRLHTLHLENDDIRLDDDAVSRLAQSLPDLRVFRIIPLNAYFRVCPIQIGLTALHKLAELCPNIEAFAAGIDFESISSISSCFPPTGSHLRQLGVGQSLLQSHDAERAAAVLCAWFPRLRIVSFWEGPEGLENDQQAKWEAVEGFIAKALART
ncbi:hypothetical protein HGRIS_006215 [Hohenbuehelia grisea]|uniref:F-box domain-containing protein n=1 Tax=Hohenbuehelia grisea TaxID=104357 RepID=A0ABR3K1E5_9AGAR